MVNNFIHWLFRWSAGDVVSAIGLAVAIWQIVRARSLAEQLKIAVSDVRQQLERRTAASRLNELIRDLQELKEISRAEIPAVSLKRFTAVRLKLIEIRLSFGGWSGEQEIVLQESVSQLSKFEQLLESALKRSQAGPKDLSKKLNEQMDNLVKLLAVVQNEERRG